MVTKYKILSVAGGGVRAVVSAIWLKKLEDMGYLKTEDISLWSGTSAGSMVVAGLIKPDPVKISDLEDLAKEVMGYAFRRRKWIPETVQLLFTAAKYHTEYLEDVAKSVYGADVLFKDCKPACINVYDRYYKYRGVRRAMGHAITNLQQPSEKETRFGEMPLYQLVTSSCVAPLAFQKYMPTLKYQTRNGDHKEKTFNFTDGGQADNLGMVSAVRLARRAHCGTKEVMGKYPSGSVRFADMRVLGVGNGGLWTFQSPKEYMGGFLGACYRRFRWTAKMTLGTIVQETEVRSLETTRDMFGELSNHVEYVNYQLDREISLDDVGQFEYLKYFAEKKSELLEKDYRSYFRGYWNG